MSNLSDSRDLNNASHKKTDKKPKAKSSKANQSRANKDIDALTAEATDKKKRWSFIQNDLSQALDTWDELEKSAVPLSPEEEQFVKIKTMIEQLKDKLEQF